MIRKMNGAGVTFIIRGEANLRGRLTARDGVLPLGNVNKLNLTRRYSRARLDRRLVAMPGRSTAACSNSTACATGADSSDLWRGRVVGSLRLVALRAADVGSDSAEFRPGDCAREQHQATHLFGRRGKRSRSRPYSGKTLIEQVTGSL